MAGFISKQTIDLIHSNTDIISLVGEYTKLQRRQGNDWWGCCPFHSEKTPSFHVDGDKRLYYCFGCNASGDSIKFVMEMEKLSYNEAAIFLAKRNGIEIVYENGNFQEHFKVDNKKEEYIDLYERCATLFHYFLTQEKNGEDALSYIQNRGITSEIISKFKLGYAPKDRYWLKKFLKSKNFSEDFLNESGLFSKNYPDCAFFSDRLMFPIFNRQGKCVAFGGRILKGDGPKYLNSSDLIQYKKGSTLYAFNFAKNAIREENAVIFCEGYMDCIAYHQCGINYAVAPLGTALTEEQLKLIQGFASTILFSFDSDKAGENATLRAIYMARKNGFTVKIISFSSGKDPAEIMLNYGKDALTNLVKSAILDSDYLLSKLGREYAIDTPEGKAKASYAFFPYLESLQSDIQREACLQQLCQAFNLKVEAVKRDFSNRKKTIETSGAGSPKSTIAELSLNAELRVILAVIANLDEYVFMRERLSVDNFEDSVAKQLFVILEDCFQSQALSISTILARCNDEKISQMITRVISSSEFSKETAKAVIHDGIELLKRNELEKKRMMLTTRIKNFRVLTKDDEETLKQIIQEKMELDKILKQ